MTPRDVDPHDMPDELDALLADLRHAADTVPPPPAGPALASLFRDGAPPVVSPSPARRWAGRAAVAAVVAGLGFGGLGVAGALPAPLQARVADLVEPVGIDLPDGDDERPAPPVTTTTSPNTSTSTTAATTPAVSAPPASPGRSGDAPGRSDSAPGRSGDTPAGDAPGRQQPAPRGGNGIDHPDAEVGRNPTATDDVDSTDRPGRRPADDGGPRR